MACGKSLFLFFALVAAHGFVLAQEASESSSNDSSNQIAPQSENQAPSNQAAPQSEPQAPEDNHEGRAGFGDFFGNNSSNIFGQFLSSFGQLFPGLGNNNSSSSPSIPFFPFLGSFGRSQSLDFLPDFDSQDSSPHDRFFFHSHGSSSGVPIGCNYTSQPGYSCAGCREQFLCRENGVGRLRVCPFYAPYCYNGVCGSFVNTTCTNSTG